MPSRSVSRASNSACSRPSNDFDMGPTRHAAAHETIKSRDGKQMRNPSICDGFQFSLPDAACRKQKLEEADSIRAPLRAQNRKSEGKQNEVGQFSELQRFLSGRSTSSCCSWMAGNNFPLKLEAQEPGEPANLAEDRMLEPSGLVSIIKHDQILHPTSQSSM